MAKLEMKVRRLKTGETLVATLESFDDAVTWLGERPEYVEVLGVLSEDLTPAMDRALRAAMRPYTDEEHQLIQEADRRAEAAIREQIERESAMAEQRRREHAEAMRQADPDRPMMLRWHHEEGLEISDPYDDREITEAAREAVDAWIAERNTWVADRGQKVIEAMVTVYPGPVPSGNEADRVQPGGQFIPGSA